MADKNPILSVIMKHIWVKHFLKMQIIVRLNFLKV